MRRRSFIQAAVAAAAATTMTGRGAFAAESEFESRLLALAAVIVPGSEPGTWRNSAVASALLAEIGDPGRRERRERYRAALEQLNRATDDRAGESFFALAGERQAGVLKKLIESDEEFGKKIGKEFAAMREDVLRVYFSSGAGMKFTGYRETTQFVGYPEFFQLAETWE